MINLTAVTVYVLHRVEDDIVMNFQGKHFCCCSCWWC